MKPERARESDGPAPHPRGAYRQRVESWLAEPGPVRPEYARRWLALLDWPLDELRSALIEDSPEMRVLRQSSPFAGALSEEERLAVIRGVR